MKYFHHICLLFFLGSVYHTYAIKKDSVLARGLERKPYLTPRLSIGLTGGAGIAYQGGFTTRELMKRSGEFQPVYKNYPVLSYNSGISINAKVFKNFHVALETYYIQKGGKFTLVRQFGSQREAIEQENILNYIEIPFYIQGRFGQKRLQFLMNAGIFWAQFLNGTTNYSKTISNPLYTESFNETYQMQIGKNNGPGYFDIGLLFGLGMLYRFNAMVLMLDIKSSGSFSNAYRNDIYLDYSENTALRINITAYYPLVW